MFVIIPEVLVSDTDDVVYKSNQFDFVVINILACSHFTDSDLINVNTRHQIEVSVQDITDRCVHTRKEKE